MRQHDRAPRDDEGSIAMALMLIMVGISLAALLVPLIVTQVNNTKTDYRRQHALDAAQAGLDYVVGQIRGASDAVQANGANGVRAKLPCTMSGSTMSTMTDKMSTAGNQRYRVSVYYFQRDPHGHPEWLTDSTKWVKCSAGSGTPTVPNYAVVVSTGTDDAGGSFDQGTRTVQATYALKTLNVNVPGGSIYNYDPSNPGIVLCLDAGSTSPTSGTPVTLENCSSGLGSQTWSYNSNLTISIPDSRDSAVAGDLGMCLDAATPHYNGELVTVQPCESTTNPRQQFSLGLFAELHTYSAATKLEAFCFNPTSPKVAGTSIVIGGCDSDPTKPYTVGRPFGFDASVGTGGADAAHKFIVNYGKFGRCISSTYGKLFPGPTYDQRLYVNQCTASADPNAQALGQLFNFPKPATGSSFASGQITSTTTKDGKTYCVISPMTLGGYPYVDVCADAPAGSTTWTVWADTGTYATSYRITDSSHPDPTSDLGYCLSFPEPKDVKAGDGTSGQRLLITTCSASTLQKWNAPPGIIASPVSDYQELYRTYGG